MPRGGLLVPPPVAHRRTNGDCPGPDRALLAGRYRPTLVSERRNIPGHARDGTNPDALDAFTERRTAGQAWHPGFVLLGATTCGAWRPTRQAIQSRASERPLSTRRWGALCQIRRPAMSRPKAAPHTTPGRV